MPDNVSDPNTPKGFRAALGITQAVAADLVGYGVRSWKIWESAGAFPDNVLASVKAVLANRPQDKANVQALRKSSGLSMAKCAELVGVTAGTWKRWETWGGPPADLSQQLGSAMTRGAGKPERKEDRKSRVGTPADPFGLESLQHLRHQAPEPKPAPKSEPETEFVPICGKNITPQDLEIIQKIAAKS